MPKRANAAMTPSDENIRDVLLRLAFERGASKSFCPSEAARALATDWRPLMPQIRAVAAQLQAEGLLRCTQKGQDVTATDACGPIRLSLPAGPSASPR